MDESKTHAELEDAQLEEASGGAAPVWSQELNAYACPYCGGALRVQSSYRYFTIYKCTKCKKLLTVK